MNYYLTMYHYLYSNLEELGMIHFGLIEHDWKPLESTCIAWNDWTLAMDCHFNRLDPTMKHSPPFEVIQTPDTDWHCLHRPNCVMPVYRQIFVVWHMELCQHLGLAMGSAYLFSLKIYLNYPRFENCRKHLETFGKHLGFPNVSDNVQT